VLSPGASYDDGAFGFCWRALAPEQHAQFIRYSTDYIKDVVLSRILPLRRLPAFS
jgi:hypothetical protein